MQFYVQRYTLLYDQWLILCSGNGICHIN